MANPMIFLTDTETKPKIIKNGQELIQEQKSSLEKLYCLDNYHEKEKEINNFINDFIIKCKQLLQQNDVDDIFEHSNYLIKFTNHFIDKNKGFITVECREIINCILYLSIGIGIILCGILQLEKSRLINDQLKSTSFAYDGVDRIAVSLEKYLNFFPNQILLEVKKILENIQYNADKNYQENIDYLYNQEDEKIYVVNNLVSMKRACNSTILLIEKYLKKNREEQQIIDLYPSQESFEYIRKQQYKFSQIDKNKLKEYQGQFIFFEDDKIKDADLNEETLVQRVMNNVGYRDIFITKV